jgi:hypothetical protein
VLDNFISRVIGFLTRTIVIVSALIVMLITAVGGLVLFILWPLAPFAIVFLIYKAFV